MRKGNPFLRSPVALAAAGAITTTILAIASGGLRQSGPTDWNPVPIHYGATYVMLGSYVVLMFAIHFARNGQLPPATVQTIGDILKISDCTHDNVWEASQLSLTEALRHPMPEQLISQLRRCRVAVFNGMIIPSEISNLWPSLPNLKILDVQNASLPTDFWIGLERCSELEHVLVHGATCSTSPKEILMSLPELRIHQSPTTVLF